MNSSNTILLVEDDDNDALFFRRALTQAKLDNPVHRMGSGTEAINYLRGVAPFADREKYPLPLVIFVDLGMPEMNGYDLLRWIKNHDHFSTIPVMILTGLVDLEDAPKAKKMGAHSFFLKPLNPLHLSDLIKLIST